MAAAVNGQPGRSIPMKKGILFALLASLAFAALTSAGGCKAEGKVDDDGAKAEIKGT
jgi:hypothetical protein